MKRIIIVILFFILNILVFSEKTCNDTDFRQAMVNYANAQVGKPYSMTGPRVGPTSFDCSGLMSASIKAGGMTSISGKKGDFGTTALGLRQSSGTLISRNDFSNLKPGDIIHFSPYSSGTTGHVGIVVSNLGNGRVEMIDARGKKYGVRRRIKNLAADGHYLGATSATQILKNNSCTSIVDENGQIVVPPAGSTVGDTLTGDDASRGFTNETYEIDWDKISQKFLDQINSGVDRLLGGIGYLMVIMCCIDFMYYLIKKKGE